MFVIAGCPQGESWLYITNLSQIALLDVSSDEVTKVYIWTMSVRLAGYSGEELTCVADTLNRLYTASILMVWTMLGPAAA